MNTPIIFLPRRKPVTGKRQFGVVGLDADDVRGAAGCGHLERLTHQRRATDHFEDVVGTGRR